MKFPLPKLPLLFLLMAALSVPARATPTLDQTIAYLTDKLNDLPPVSWDSEKGVTREVSGMKVEWFNNGTLSIVAIQRRSEGGKSPAESLMRFQFPLSTLSAAITVVPAGTTTTANTPAAYGVVISSADDPKTPQGTIVVLQDDGLMHTWKKATLWFRSEDTAHRVADAIQHAIQLSGGKKELFGN